MVDFPQHKIRMAAPVTDDNVFNELRLVNEIWTQFPPQVGEKGRTHRSQSTGAVIHHRRTSWFEIVATGANFCSSF
jgi:hypothetical protein